MMRALVVETPGTIRLRDADDPSMGAGDVLIRSVCAAICGTDVKILEGQLPDGTASYPCIPGHEWSGIVENVSPGAAGLKPGMPVVCEGRLWCGRCSRCLAGETNFCERYAQLGFTHPGGYGELLAVPARYVHPIPQPLALEAAALVEPLSCVLHAFERGRVASADTVAVVGIGGLGGIAILAARARGLEVLAYGVRASELAFARALGADDVVDALASDAPVDSRADVVIETSGMPAAVATATRAARAGGRIVLVGTGGVGSSVAFADDELVRRELTVMGSLSYTASDWRVALELAGSGAVDLQRVVTHRYPLADYAAALRRFEERDEAVGRILLVHEE